MQACKERCAAHSSSCRRAASLSLLRLWFCESGWIQGLTLPTTCHDIAPTGTDKSKYICKPRLMHVERHRPGCPTGTIAAAGLSA